MALVKCPECGKEISSKATACPNCGARPRKPFYKRWWFRIISALVVLPAVLLMVLVGASLLFSDSSSGYSDADLELVSVRIVESKTGEKVVRGEIRNNSEYDLHLVRLIFAGYDKDGNVVDDAATHCSFLGAGETWEFETVGRMKKSVVTVEVTTLRADDAKLAE